MRKKPEWMIGAFMIFGLSAGVGISAEAPRVEIQVREGQAHVQSTGSDLTPQDLKRLEGMIQKRIDESPFRREGTIKMSLQGDRAKEIQDRVKEARGGNDEELEDALEDALEKNWSQRGPSGPDRVYLGQSFEVDADQRFGSIVVIGGSGTIKGEVRELVAVGSRVDLAPTARVNERLVSIGSTVNRAPGARVREEEVSVSLPGMSAWFEGWKGPSHGMVAGMGMQLVWVVMTWAVGIALGIAFLHLFPQFHSKTAKYLEAERGRSFGIGVLGHLLLIPGALLLVLTVVGIVLVPLYFVLYLCLLVVGHLLVGWVLGKRLLKRQTAPSEAAVYTVGLGVLALLRLVPFAGPFVVWILSMAGFGAALRELSVWIRGRKKLA